MPGPYGVTGSPPPGAWNQVPGARRNPARCSVQVLSQVLHTGLGWGEGAAAGAAQDTGKRLVGRVMHEWGVLGTASAAASHCKGNKVPIISVLIILIRYISVIIIINSLCAARPQRAACMPHRSNMTGTATCMPGRSNSGPGQL